MSVRRRRRVMSSVTVIPTGHHHLLVGEDLLVVHPRVLVAPHVLLAVDDDVELRAEGKGGHQRIVPITARFFATLATYLDNERPPESSTDRVFVVLKGPRRGQPLSADGLDEILDGARRRATLAHATCHELRHTCLTRLREAGMALEAIQAQAGHASIETTRIYVHLASDRLVEAAPQDDVDLLGDGHPGWPAMIMDVQTSTTRTGISLDSGATRGSGDGPLGLGSPASRSPVRAVVRRD